MVYGVGVGGVNSYDTVKPLYLVYFWGPVEPQFKYQQMLNSYNAPWQTTK